MNISDLVAVGKLGRLEPDGFYCVQFSQPYKPLFKQLRECFLIFSSHRVFFVTVVGIKTSGPRQYFRFREDGIAEECLKSAKVIVAIAQEDLDKLEAGDKVRRLFGFSAEYQGEVIGTITDAMINPQQTVFIIALKDDSELMVPDVEHYVESVDIVKSRVRFRNLESLLEVCRSTS